MGLIIETTYLKEVINLKNDALGDRMKGYENVNRNYLTKRTPVIIRL